MVPPSSENEFDTPALEVRRGSVTGGVLVLGQVSSKGWSSSQTLCTGGREGGMVAPQRKVFQVWGRRCEAGLRVVCGV